MKYHSRLFMFFFLFPFCVIAQTGIKRYEQMVYASLRDSRGLIWLGTENGLFLFQGDHLLPWPLQRDTSSAHANGIVYALQEDPHGLIWIGAYTGGITLLNPRSNSIRHLPDTGILARCNLNSLQLHQGVMQVNTSQGVVLCSLDSFRLYRHKKLPSKKNVLLSKHYHATDYTLVDGLGLHLHNAQYDTLLYPPSGEKALMGLNKIGNRIFITSYKGIYVLESFRLKKLAVYYRGEEISSSGFNDVLETEEGQTYLNSLKYGMLHFTYQSEKLLCVSDENNTWFREGNTIYSNYYDRASRTFFIGTQQGLFVVRRPGIIRQVHPTPEDFGTIRALLPAADGLYIGTEDGAFIWNSQLKRLAGSKTMKRPLLCTIHQAGNDIVGSGHNLYQIKNHTLGFADPQMARLLEGESFCVSANLEDSRIGIYSKIRQTLYLLDATSKRVLDSARLNLDMVTQIASLHSKIWMATFTGLYVWDIHSRRLDTIHIPGLKQINHIELGSESAWLCSDVMGITNYSYRDKTIRQIPLSPVTRSSDVKSMYLHSPYLWFTTQDGIGYYQLLTGHIRYYLAGELFPTGKFMQHVIAAQGDTLYAGGVNQLIALSMSQLENQKAQDTCYLMHLSLLYQGKRQLVDINQLEFKHDENNLELYAVQTQVNQRRSNRYAYRLNKGEELPVEEDGLIRLYNLAPGNYNLQLVLLNEQRVVQSLQFNILPPWYQSTWFRLLLILLAAANAMWITRLYFKRQLIAKQKELEKQQALQTQRDRISMDMHDDLGSGLSSIKMISEMLKRKHADTSTREELDQIVQESTELTATMRDLVWSLNPRNDTLGGFIDHSRRFVKQYFEKAEIEVNLLVSCEEQHTAMNGLARRNLLLVLKETCTNIYKHAQTKKVDIEIGCTASELYLLMTDHGRGLPQPHRENNGFYSMRKRMQEIGGSIEWHSDAGGVHTEIRWPFATL